VRNLLDGCIGSSGQDDVSSLLDTELPGLLLRCYSRGLLLLSTATAAAGAAQAPSQEEAAALGDPVDLKVMTRLTAAVMDLVVTPHAAVTAPAIEDSGECCSQPRQSEGKACLFAVTQLLLVH
jgi:hypothetical protein